MLFGKISHEPHRGRLTQGVLASGFCVFLLLVSSAEAQVRTLNPEVAEQLKSDLRSSGIDPTEEGLAGYLKELHPNPESTQRTERLIAALGNDDFYEREAAMRELLRLPVRSPDLFKKAIEADDAEISWRARQVLKQGNNKTEQLLHAALLIIRHEKMEGLLSLVMDAIPYCTQTYVRDEAVRALKAIALPSDAETIKAALERPDPETIRVAIETLEHLQGSDADPELLPFLRSDDEMTKLAAARALGNHGNRDVLPVLVDLLAAKDLQVRARTAETLRLLTGQRFAFVAYDAEPKRAAARSKWVNWVTSNAETAKLAFPLPDGPVLRDHTLICNYSLKKVIELDANHKEIWSTELVGAWGCQGLPNGHRLVTSYSQRFVVEYDTAGKEVWKKQNLPGLPYSVERLDNGNTLVTCSNNQVLEYAPNGNIAWQQQFNGTPRDAQRLDNGNTLVVLYTTQELVEVDRSGKVVWKAGNMLRPMCAQRLPNGNTLVCQSAGQRLVEVDQKGAIVWNLNLRLSVYDAQRLPNGNTLVVGSTGATEYDANGKEVWQFNQPGMRGIHRF